MSFAAAILIILIVAFCVAFGFVVGFVVGWGLKPVGWVLKPVREPERHQPDDAGSWGPNSSYDQYEARVRSARQAGA